MSTPGTEPRIEPVAFQAPGSKRAPAKKKRSLRPLPIIVGAALLIFAVCAWFLFTAQSVSLRFDPQADEVSISGGLSLPLGGRFLLRPGEYTVSASAQGYAPFEQKITVQSGGNAPFEFSLQKLPGRLEVTSKPSEATVVIDGEEAGPTPLQPVKLKPGDHKVVVRARRYEVYETTVQIEGKDELQSLDVELKPAWAAITLNSKPTGATLKVDGEVLGKTPLSEDIGAGDRRLTLELEGYQVWQKSLQVVAEKDQTLGTVELQKIVGKLKVSSSPAGANVSAGGDFRGRTPLTITLSPNKNTDIKISKVGYESATHSASVPSGDTQNLSVELKPILGTVKFSATPADASLFVDGQDRGSANQSLSLTSTAHSIEIRKDGYESFKTSVTPKPGLEQSVSTKLVTPEQANIASTPAVIDTAAGQRMRLIRPGSFTMGAPRREQGRQANETEKDVKLTRAFYLSTTEVTNKQFRAFRDKHSSGIVQRTTLDNDNYPAVRISWEDAVAYCNWLSQREGLPQAYQGGELITPVNTGYRLPTEAEWSWAARFAGSRNLKYPWGGSMPPPDSAGNFADMSAAPLISEHLQSYNDGYKAAAPVGRFSANGVGIFDMGGNAAEWVNDSYTTSLGVIGRTETDPLGPSSGGTHVIRGSSWRHGRITELRLSYRDFDSQPRDDLGFRIARYAQ